MSDDTKFRLIVDLRNSEGNLSRKLFDVDKSEMLSIEIQKAVNLYLNQGYDIQLTIERVRSSV